MLNKLTVATDKENSLIPRARIIFNEHTRIYTIGVVTGRKTEYDRSYPKWTITECEIASTAELMNVAGQYIAEQRLKAIVEMAGALKHRLKIRDNSEHNITL